MQISHKFSLLSFALIVFISQVGAWFVIGCGQPVITERLDPIVSPGNISSHVHHVVGGNAFDWETDYNTTQTSTCTTCEVLKDLSNYWVPVLYFQHDNGSFEHVPQLGGLNIYYQPRIDWTEIDQNLRVHAFPKGFRMIAGHAMRRSYNASSLADQAVEFDCIDNGNYPGLPSVNCDGGLQVRVTFPSCWDGVNLDSDDHRSHVEYPSLMDNGVCPETHPVRLIKIMIEATWSVSYFDDIRKPESQPFVFSNGDPTGYGYHGDFINGWDVDLLQAAIDDQVGCGDAYGGVTAMCAELNGTDVRQNATYQDQCSGTLQPTRVTEQVFGLMDKLPGCNPVQSGPADATPAVC